MSGDLTVDTSSLHVDAANNRVGVGVASPSQKLHVEGAGTQFLLNNSTTNDGLYLKAGSGAVSLQTGGGGHTMNFFTSGTERLRILSGGGLTFNGDTAAANALDDYEEGTWTPADGRAGLTLTQEATQRYVKIGSLVFVNMYVGYPSTTNSSTAIISGFPYAASSFNFLSGRVFNSGTNDMVWQVNGSSATLYFNNGLRTNANLTGAYVLLSGSYYTTS